MKRPLRAFLNLTRLEDRTVPATATYAAGTLTITAATGDIVLMNPVLPNSILGYYRVDVGGTNIFNSGNDRPVRNLVVQGNAAVNYGFIFGLGISLNNVTMSGARGVGPLISNILLGADTRISGNFTFTGNAAGGDDLIFLGGAACIGGNVSINSQGGNDLFDIGGGSIGGSVPVNGGAGDDTFNVVAVAPLTVGGKLMSISVMATMARMASRPTRLPSAKTSPSQPVRATTEWIIASV
jgi:hypothetical protein